MLLGANHLLKLVICSTLILFIEESHAKRNILVLLYLVIHIFIIDKSIFLVGLLLFFLTLSLVLYEPLWQISLAVLTLRQMRFEGFEFADPAASSVSTSDLKVTDQLVCQHIPLKLLDFNLLSTHGAVLAQLYYACDT